jgi:Zn-dependent protease with chaperone function
VAVIEVPGWREGSDALGVNSDCDAAGLPTAMTAPFADLYPPSVTGAPPDLVTPSRRYRLFVGVVLTSLILFLALYLGMVVGAGWLFWLALTYPLEEGRGSLFLKVCAIAMSGMLFLFLVKALFKQRRHEDPLQMEIRESDHPALFAFIRRLCAETGAPFPYRVFLHPEVNASVFYNTSLLNLIFPVRKNLMIGLGLVNAVPLSEFKAVLAHEFGHFSQRSMRLGSYVYVINRILADMVGARDFFDDWLAKWKRIGDFRIAAAGWVFYGIVWLLRQVLTLVFHLINRGEAALSREMEFHADLVAVSVCGSDAPAHLLKRLGPANDALMCALQELKTAAQHKIYTRDLFYHQDHAIPYLRTLRRDPEWGVPPALPADPNQQVRVFEAQDDSVPDMYASHPPNHLREANAKRVYLRSPQDDRSPWLLFQDPAAVREAATRRFYEVNADLPSGAPLADPAEVQRFIDDERVETTYDPRYYGLYNERFVLPGETAELLAVPAEAPWERERIEALFRRLYEGELTEFAEAYHRRNSERQMLAGLDSGEYRLRKSTFEFRGQECGKKDVKRLLETVEKEQEREAESLKDLDAAVFRAHFHAAREAAPGLETDLLNRYVFHVGAQEVAGVLNTEGIRCENVLNFISEQESPSEETVKDVARHLREAQAAAAAALEKAQGLVLPALRNLPEGTPLRDFLLEGEWVEPLPENEKGIPGEWIGKLMTQFHHTRERAGRVHFKSLGAILALQERIAVAYRGAPLPPPVPWVEE